jgi:type I restriction enzyme R subunit
MANKEATARIKINKLLEAADWRFFADGTKPANIRLETSATIKSSDLEALGENFEKKIQAALARVWSEDNQAPVKE